MTFIKLLILLILCILAIKISFIIISVIKSSYSITRVFIAPLKRIYIWEYNNLKVLIRNLFLQKKDIFKSLASSEEVGVVRENINNPINNNILGGIFHLSWQIFGIIILSTYSYSDLFYIISGIKQNLLFVFISIIISVIYVRFKIVKITPIENQLFKSTMPFNIELDSKKGINDE
jgi:hypothetical protein